MKKLELHITPLESMIMMVEVEVVADVAVVVVAMVVVIEVVEDVVVMAGVVVIAIFKVDAELVTFLTTNQLKITTSSMKKKMKMIFSMITMAIMIVITMLPITSINVIISLELRNLILIKRRHSF
jgi:hypothetical protein